MITKFLKYTEAVDYNDAKNILNYKLDDNEASKDNKDIDLKKDTNLKISDLLNRIKDITEQKKMIEEQIIKLQSAQRDLAPNNPNDPKNAEKLKMFTNDQMDKIRIQKLKIDAYNQEIDNLKKEIERHKNNYL